MLAYAQNNANKASSVQKYNTEGLKQQKSLAVIYNLFDPTTAGPNAVEMAQQMYTKGGLNHIVLGAMITGAHIQGVINYLRKIDPKDSTSVYRLLHHRDTAGYPDDGLDATDGLITNLAKMADLSDAPQSGDETRCKAIDWYLSFLHR
eukprot:g300.t1